MENSKNQSEKQAALISMLRDLRTDILLWMVVLLSIAGALFAISAASFANTVVGVGLSLLSYGLAAAIFMLRNQYFKIAAWVMVIGIFFIVLLLATWAKIPEAVYLFGVPAGLAILIIHPAAGLTIAGASTMLLLLPSGPLSTAGTTQSTVVAVIFIHAGIVWLAVHPLQNALEIAYVGYKEGRGLLEKARDTHMELNQTLDDLKDANTQLTRLNRLVQSLYRAAEESRRVKEQFVANVSHELRTPLNMIIGFSEMILKSPGAYGRKVPSALLADLSVIVRNSLHLSELIDDVLDLSQIEAGQMAITREMVPMSEIIESAVVAVRPLFESKRLYLTSTCPPDVQVFCDRTRIREVLINLLSNAGRFTAEGGVELNAVVEGNHLTIAVEDTGPGLSVEDQKQLFQPFHQVDSSIRRRFGGTGLGLSISKSFVELHDGKMWVESEKGAGAKFSFTLPIEMPAPIEHRATRWINPYQSTEPRTHLSHAPAPVIRPRFLVMDEGSTLQRLLQRYIDQVEIESANTITSACQQLAATPAQALLVNSQDPQEVLEHLHCEGFSACGVPAIICSIPNLAENTSHLGVAGYLVKPITREVLLAKVESFRPEVKTVLIVDDESDVIQIFRRMLVSSEKGYRILTAMDGAQALGLMHTEQPDLVLLDLSMPVEDGFAVLSARNAYPEIHNIPVVITSARDPLDQPLASPFLTVTRGSGLSATEMLSCIQSLSQILGPNPHE